MEAGQETPEERRKRLDKQENDYIINKTPPNHRRMYEIKGLGDLRKELKLRKKRSKTLIDE